MRKRCNVCGTEWQQSIEIVQDARGTERNETERERKEVRRDLKKKG